MLFEDYLFLRAKVKLVIFFFFMTQVDVKSIILVNIFLHFIVMNSRHKIGQRALAAMNRFLDNEKDVGQAARPPDMLFITDGSWLKDAAVIDKLVPSSTHSISPARAS